MSVSKSVVSPLLSVAVIATSDRDALKKTLLNLPSDMANVAIVIACTGTGEKFAAKIFIKFTTIQIQDVQHGQQVAANTIYVVPAGYKAKVKNNIFSLTELDAGMNRQQPINVLLQSLAASGYTRPVAIILSGEGTDGAAGLKAIKAAGGVCIVQQPVSAKNKEMPLAAIQSCLVDVVLTPENIGLQLRSIVRDSKKNSVIQQTNEQVAANTAEKLPDKFKAVNERLQTKKNPLARDTTALRNSGSELAYSQQLMDSVFHTADIGIAVFNSNGTFIKVNDGLCKLLGFKQQELIQHSYLTVVPPKSKPEARVLMQKYFNEELANVEKKVLCKDGRLIDCYMTNNLFSDQQGNKFMVTTFRDVSENRRYRELLQHAEKINKMGGFELNLASGKYTWTDEVYDIYEVDKTFKPTFTKVLRFYKEDYVRLIKKAVSKAATDGKPYNFECKFTTKGNKIKWLEIIGNPVKQKGKIISVRGTINDVTQRKETELQLKRLSAVASKTNNAVIITDAEGRTEWVNESFIKMTGYDTADIYGKKPGLVLQGKGTDKVAVKNMSEALKKQLPVSQVVKNYRKNGTAFWVSMDIMPIIENGKVLNFIGVGTDITEIIEARGAQKEKAAMEQKQVLFNAIAKNFPDGIIGVLDKELNYVFAGGAEIEKLGLTPGHLIGEHVFDSISSNGNTEIEPFLAKAFLGETVSFEQEVKGNTYAINAVPLFSNRSKVEQILVVLYNITKRKKAEDEVWQALTRQLQLNEMKSKFVSIASHEFRTPLSGILSSAYLISMYSELNDVENLQKHADRISASVRTLTDILNDFLSLGKMDEGKVQNHFTTFSVTGFCHQLVEDFQPNLKIQQQLIYEHKGINEVATLDKEHLRHVLSNLISNAVKYSSEGKKIWLNSATKNGHITFSVKDEGIGIPAEAQPHLFQTFFRAENAADYQGTGMGLHIVKRFLDVMGGSIRFSSKLNQGTIFTIRFPVLKPVDKSKIFTDVN